jgi:sugar phosphate isomerase/epimerase
MNEEDPVKAFESFIPYHIHLSSPNLGTVPGTLDFKDFIFSVKNNNYNGWLVIESLGDSIDTSLSSIKWLRSELGKIN